MTYTPTQYTLEDLDEAFALLTPSQVEYARDNGLTLDSRLAYNDNHWLYKDEPADWRFNNALGEVVMWYRALATGSYGLRD